MSIGMTVFTILHVVISLAGIGSGVVVAYGFLTAKRLDTWTTIFIATTVLTSVTGFFFPVERFLPSHAVGILSLIVLAVAIFARYARQLTGIYVVSSVIALYLNVFVLVVQLFQKVPALASLAPTQSEPPFLLVQVAVLALFVGIGIGGAVRFRIEEGYANRATRNAEGVGGWSIPSRTSNREPSM